MIWIGRIMECSSSETLTLKEQYCKHRQIIRCVVSPYNRFLISFFSNWFGSCKVICSWGIQLTLNQSIETRSNYKAVINSTFYNWKTLPRFILLNQKYYDFFFYHYFGDVIKLPKVELNITVSVTKINTCHLRFNKTGQIKWKLSSGFLLIISSNGTISIRIFSIDEWHNIWVL